VLVENFLSAMDRVLLREFIAFVLLRDYGLSRDWTLSFVVL